MFHIALQYKTDNVVNFDCIFIACLSSGNKWGLLRKAKMSLCSLFLQFPLFFWSYNCLLFYLWNWWCGIIAFFFAIVSFLNVFFFNTKWSLFYFATSVNYFTKGLLFLYSKLSTFYNVNNIIFFFQYKVSNQYLFPFAILVFSIIIARYFISKSLLPDTT